MRMLFTIIPVLLLTAACHREGGSVTVLETLKVDGPSTTRVRLSDGVNAVWSAGDKVSVFFNGGENEQWNYTGADGSAKGTISHEGSAWRVGNGRFTALYPYDSGASISGEVISTTLPAVQEYVPSSYGWALMVSSTEDASLHFEYASAFVRLTLVGTSKVKRLTLKGNNGEALAGPATVDISGNSPVAAYGSGTTQEISVGTGDAVLATVSADGTDFWFGLLPVTFTKGFTITVTLESGSEEEYYVSGPVSLQAGVAFCVHGRLFGFETLTFEFVKKASSFSPLLPATGSLSTSNGTHSYDSGHGTYSLTFHPAYDSAWYGYGFYDHAEYGRALLLGRKGAWIKLPVLSGYALYEAEYEAGSLSGHPYLSDSSSDPANHMLTSQVSDTTPGTHYSMTLDRPVVGKQYYLVVGSGNLLMRKLILRYIKNN